MMDIGKRIDGKFNVWRMRHDGWHILTVCNTEEEAVEFIKRVEKCQN
jgi:hypothetical protein